MNATGPTLTTLTAYDRENANYSRFIIGIQRELPYNFGVEATFVYSRGRNLPVLRQLNYVPREFLNDFTGVTDLTTINTAVTTATNYLNLLVPNPFRGLVPQNGTLNAATIQRRFLLTAFPQFQDLVTTEYNGSSDYRSLQLQATKRLSRGLSFNASYTFSRDMEKTRRLNPQDEELTENLSVFDRPHRITFSGVYEIPFGKNRQFFSNWNSVAEAFLGGWQFNAVYEWQSGEPIVLQNAVYTGDITQLVNRLGQKDANGVRYGINIIPGGLDTGQPGFDTNGFIPLRQQLRTQRTKFTADSAIYFGQSSQSAVSEIRCRFDKKLPH